MFALTRDLAKARKYWKAAEFWLFGKELGLMFATAMS
jgi:hypothetical protein